MLHEILLSLSGHPSPFLSKTHSVETSTADSTGFPLLSPPERALLATLTDLSDLHLRLREQLSSLSTSHPSVVCHAVTTQISSSVLQRFQRKILEVEKSILSQDAAYVGGYGIVPLSTIVSEFAPWTRRLQWLLRVTDLMATGSNRQEDRYSTGVSIMDFLKQESYTGYRDLENIALELLQIAEITWLRLLSNWLLYGRLPTVGAQDLFLRAQDETRANQSFIVDDKMLPSFISPETAQSVLIIGRSLHQIRSRKVPHTWSVGNSSADPVSALSSIHVQFLEDLKSPFAASDVSSTVSAIRLSLSQNALAYLLPIETVLETVRVLNRFLLLQQGEFPVTLINRVDARIHEKTQESYQQVRKAGLLDNLAIREGEVTAVLNHAWADLASLRDGDDDHDEELELARDMIQLSIASKGKENPKKSTPLVVPFDDLLFPTPTVLSFRIEPPLDLFLSDPDIEQYSAISSLLLGIRRAEIHISSLWKRTSIRRCQPTPPGPPFSTSAHGLKQLQARRGMERQREINLRAYWATASAMLYLVTEVGSYLQGFVVHNHSSTFSSWLDSFDTKGKPTSFRASPILAEDGDEHAVPSSPTIGGSESCRPNAILDPATLVAAHQIYLHSLVEALFLTSAAIMQPFHELLVISEHFTALFHRLAGIHMNLDLEVEGVDIGDPTRSYSAEEKEVLVEMKETRIKINGIMQRFAEAVKAWESENDKESGPQTTKSDFESYGGFVPWSDRHGGSARGVEALIMRLEFLEPDSSKADGEDDL